MNGFSSCLISEFSFLIARLFCLLMIGVTVFGLSVFRKYNYYITKASVLMQNPVVSGNVQLHDTKYEQPGAD